MKQATGARCPQCRKPITPSAATVTRTTRGGNLMRDMHREVANHWHSECWAEAEAYVAETRAQAKADNLATLRAIAEVAGIELEESA